MNRHWTVTVLGVLAGLVGSLALSWILRSQLYGISATDPVTLIAVALSFSGIALLACWIPARRATRVDPMVAMRSE